METRSFGREALKKLLPPFPQSPGYIQYEPNPAFDL
jgi:hypothetical protein